MARQRHVVLVHVHGDAELRARLLGEADVVEVRVGEHDRLDVLRPAPERVERRVRAVPRARDAGVDHAQAAVLIDDEPVRVGVLDAVDALGRVQVQRHRARTSHTPRSGTSDRRAGATALWVAPRGYGGHAAIADDGGHGPGRAPRRRLAMDVPKTLAGSAARPGPRSGARQLRAWVAGHAVCDLADLVVTWSAREDVPARRPRLAMAIAGASTLVGAAGAAGLRARPGPGESVGAGSR
jgi:hypothetical protein